MPSAQAGTASISSCSQAQQDVAGVRPAAQDRHLVDAAQGEAVGRQRGGHTGQQHRQQRAQAEEAPGQVERLAHATLGVVHAQQAQAFHLRQQPLAQRRSVCRAGEHQPVVDAAARAEQAGALHIGAVDQQGGRERQQVATGCPARPR
jgi:hypothetical protein